MSSKNIGKLVLCIILLSLGIWTESFFPFLFILLILDSIKNKPYCNRLWSFIRIKNRKIFLTIEWLTAILFSIWFIVFLQNNFVGVYTFQTSSMHETLQVGDVLLVNKLVPGARKNSDYIDFYHRSKGLKKLFYKDVVLFNFPEGDTLIKNRPTDSYYYLKRLYGDDMFRKGGEKWAEIQYNKMTDRPRFVKRVFGLPGDSIVIEEGQFFTNGKHIEFSDLSIDRYMVDDKLKEEINKQGIFPYNELVSSEKVVWELLDRDVKKLKKLGLEPKPDNMPKNLPDPMVFPFNSHLLWNMHNMGPIYIPKKGDVIALNSFNLQMYSRLIQVFENNSLRKVGDSIYINEKLVSHYTFKMNYYWVMGDNRPHSFDSRFWGFVPENHIVGRVDLVLLSKDLNAKSLIQLRENRFLKKVN